MDLSSAIVKIDPPIHDLTLREVLDVIVRMADKPIHYSIENYGIVFTAKGPDPEPQLMVRVMKVDPNTFLQGLEGVTEMDFANTIGAGMTAGLSGGSSYGGGGYGMGGYGGGGYGMGGGGYGMGGGGYGMGGYGGGGYGMGGGGYGMGGGYGHGRWRLRHGRWRLRRWAVAATAWAVATAVAW